jgi:rare lipoprotein A
VLARRHLFATPALAALALAAPALALAALAAAAAGCGGAHRDPALASQAPARRAPASGPSAGAEERASRGSTAASAARGSSPAAAAGAGPSLRGGAGDWRAAYADRRAVETRSGLASFYSDALAGRSTASGEPYDPRAFTAASRDLPFGTVVRVVRADTGASVIVRINDRGPFGSRDRILDLSRAAAEALDMIRRGVVEIRAEILEFGGPPPRRR